MLCGFRCYGNCVPLYLIDVLWCIFHILSIFWLHLSNSCWAHDKYYRRLMNLVLCFSSMTPRRKPVRAIRTGPAATTPGLWGRRPTRNVETPTPENLDTTNRNNRNQNIDVQGDNDHIPPNAPTVDQAMINKLVEHLVAELLAESNHSNNSPGTFPPVRTTGCNYKEFRICGPIEFGGTEGVVYLVRWIEKTESVFNVSNFAESSKVKFTSFTFKDEALTWWNNYRNSVGSEVAYAMT